MSASTTLCSGETPVSALVANAVTTSRTESMLAGPAPRSRNQSTATPAAGQIRANGVPPNVVNRPRNAAPTYAATKATSIASEAAAAVPGVRDESRISPVVIVVSSAQASSVANSSPWVPGRGAQGSSFAGRTTTSLSPRASWVTTGSK